jgi:hypothetical protein
LSYLNLKRNPFIPRIILLAIVVFATVLTACTTEPKQVLFDQTHGQAFTIEQEGPLQLGSLATVLNESGLTISATQQTITDKSMTNIDALIISGPFRSYSTEEVATVKKFIQNGGRVAIMLHIATPIWGLLDALGVDVANGVIREVEGVLDKQAINFEVNTLSPHLLTKNLTSFNLYGGWPLRSADDNSHAIALSSDQAWVDLNRDKIFNQEDAIQQFELIVAGTIDEGEFIVFADDAIFQNKFLVEDNLTLAKNLGRWLAGE